MKPFEPKINPLETKREYGWITYRKVSPKSKAELESRRREIWDSEWNGHRREAWNRGNWGFEFYPSQPAIWRLCYRKGPYKLPLKILKIRDSKLEINLKMELGEEGLKQFQEEWDRQREWAKQRNNDIYFGFGENKIVGRQTFCFMRFLGWLLSFKEAFLEDNLSRWLKDLGDVLSVKNIPSKVLIFSTYCLDSVDLDRISEDKIRDLIDEKTLEALISRIPKDSILDQFFKLQIEIQTMLENITGKLERFDADQVEIRDSLSFRKPQREVVCILEDLEEILEEAKACQILFKDFQNMSKPLYAAATNVSAFVRFHPLTNLQNEGKVNKIYLGYHEIKTREEILEGLKESDLDGNVDVFSTWFGIQDLIFSLKFDVPRGYFNFVFSDVVKRKEFLERRLKEENIQQRLEDFADKLHLFFNNLESLRGLKGMDAYLDKEFRNPKHFLFNSTLWMNQMEGFKEALKASLQDKKIES